MFLSETLLLGRCDDGGGARLCRRPRVAGDTNDLGGTAMRSPVTGGVCFPQASDHNASCKALCEARYYDA